MAGIGLALSAASAFAQVKQGSAQAAMLKGQAQAMGVQAQYTRFNAKQASLKHKKTSIDELEKVLMTTATINAVAGAGHMSPFTGNPQGLRVRAFEVGGQNYATAAGNELITRLTGEAQANMQLYQADQLRQAARVAKRSGIMGAMMTLAGGAFQYYRTSIPNLGGGVPTTGAGAFGGSGAFPTSAVPMSQGVTGAAGMSPSMAPLYYGQRVGPGMLGV
jgi:hypothetical protein|tara:strand:+ start:303 stop:959 length:657 start_codon:yes stop_codon:yes gene_type:complete